VRRRCAGVHLSGRSWRYARGAVLGHRVASVAAVWDVASECSAGGARGDSLKQRRIPGIVNLFEVSDPSQIKAVANDPVVDRRFDTHTCPINWFLLTRSLAVLSFKGRRFPTDGATALQKASSRAGRTVAQIK
jgi:hypothetical protein